MLQENSKQPTSNVFFIRLLHSGIFSLSHELGLTHTNGNNGGLTVRLVYFLKEQHISSNFTAINHIANNPSKQSGDTISLSYYSIKQYPLQKRNMFC